MRFTLQAFKILRRMKINENANHYFLLLSLVIQGSKSEQHNEKLQYIRHSLEHTPIHTHSYRKTYILITI